MLEFIIKLVCTPENIIGLILNVLGIISMCFIFHEFKIKWWKSLIPIYNTFLLYKKTWKYYGFFLLELIMILLNARSITLIKKDLLFSTIDSIKTYIETETIDINVSIPLLIICSLLFICTYMIVFIFKRITYFKIVKLFQLNWFFQLGTFLIPDLFLFLGIMYVKYKKYKQNNSKNLNNIKTSFI